LALNETPIAYRGRAKWAAGAVTAVLAASGIWLLNRPTDAPALTAVTPAASAPGALEPRRTDVEAAPLPAALPAASTGASTSLARPSPPTPFTSLADALRKVQLALEGRATPKEMLEAATVLSACQGADLAVESMYKLRDQPSPESQQFEKSFGFSATDQIKRQQDFQRRCQVFDAATLARRGEFLKGAYEGGAKDSALPYLQWLNASKQEVNPELRAKLQREARQTAEDGNFMALTQYSFAFNPTPLGITEVQRQAYKEALFRIQGETSGAAMEKASRASMDDTEKMMAQWGALPPPLSPEQQREADALSRQVVDAWRNRQRKGG
jgi:hypothetical protein